MQTIHPILDSATIERFTVGNDTNRRLTQLVECYQAVFAGHPWNEWKVCSTCGQKWGSSERSVLGDSFIHCGQSVKDYWPTETVTSDIRHEVTEETSCWVVVHEDKVIGFCWGYPINVQKLQEKLRLPDFTRDIQQAYGDINQVAYQDELGVLEGFRGLGLAKAMYRVRHQDFLNRGLEVGIVRTKRTPPSVTYSWFTRIGYKVTSEYRDADDRVVLARKLQGFEL